jgi:hypothetical protein
MRYLPATGGHGSTAFNESRRPDLDKLPPSLAEKIRARDRIMAQRSAANHRVNELGTDQATQAATQADDEAAAKAARAGKTIPAPSALPKLEAERAKAAHAAQAHETAFVEITHECDYLASDLYWASADERAADRADARAAIATQAAALADAVEAQVDRHAIADWLQTGIYDRTAQTWPTEILDLARYGLDRNNTSPLNIRGAIIGAATACLTEPTEQ